MKLKNESIESNPHKLSHIVEEMYKAACSLPNFTDPETVKLN